MIRRNPRSFLPLSKRVTGLQLIGGDKDFCAVCFGYKKTDDGLTVCAAPSEQIVTTLTANEFFSARWYPTYGQLLMTYVSGMIMVWERKKNIWYSFAELPAGKPFIAEARNEQGHPLIVAVCGNGMCVYDVTTRQKTNTTLTNSLYGGVVHCGRLFAADESDGYKIVWSGLRVTDWEYGIQGSGYLLLDPDAGKIVKLVNFGDDLLCVREKGFTVLHAMADSRNFRIAPSQCAIGIRGTVCGGGLVGRIYYFASEGGLYAFDGDKVSLVYGVNGLFTSCKTAYTYDDGFVYVDCVYDGKNCLMRYDPESGDAVFFGNGCSSLFVAEGKAYCATGFDFRELSVFNEEERLWRSTPILPRQRKTLKTLWISGSGDITTSVVCGGVRRTLQGFGKFTVNAAGEDMFIEVGGHGKVTELYIELEARK